MSRSRKRHPWCKDNTMCKFGKRYANRKFRRTRRHITEDSEVFQHNAYQKNYCQWAIRDYCSYYTRRQAIQEYYDQCNPDSYSKWGITEEQKQELVDKFKTTYPTAEDYLQQFWMKYYYRK